MSSLCWEQVKALIFLFCFVLVCFPKAFPLERYNASEQRIIWPRSGQICKAAPGQSVVSAKGKTVKKGIYPPNSPKSWLGNLLRLYWNHNVWKTCCIGVYQHVNFNLLIDCYSFCPFGQTIRLLALGFSGTPACARPLKNSHSFSLPPFLIWGFGNRAELEVWCVCVQVVWVFCWLVLLNSWMNTMWSWHLIEEISWSKFIKVFHW